MIEEGRGDGFMVAPPYRVKKTINYGVGGEWWRIRGWG